MNLSMIPGHKSERNGNYNYIRASLRGTTVLVVLVTLWFIGGQVQAQETGNSGAGIQQTDKQDKKTDESKPVQTGETPGTQSQSTPKDSNKNKSGKVKKEKRGELVIAPVPVSSPAIGSGLVAIGAYVFPFNKNDKISPPSTVGIALLATSNGSRALGLGSKFYFKEDKYRLTAAVADGNINVDLFGVGKIAGDRGTSLPFTFKGSGLYVEPLTRVRENVYLGFRFQFRDLSASLNRKKVAPPDGNPILIDIIKDILGDNPPDLLRAKTVSLGPKLQWDTRDNTFSAGKGVLLEGSIDIFSTAIGSKFSYQYYKLAFNKYTRVRERQVLAYRAIVCAAGGERVPVYDQCIFGSSNDLRGYAAGRYIDRRMYATQGEYRLSLPGTSLLSRFGFVVFGGVGGVGHSFSEFNFLPAGGAGVRFRLTKKDPINFRVDFGVGKNGHTLSIGVLEAF